MSVRERSRTVSTTSLPPTKDENIIKDGWLYIAKRKATNRFERRYCVLYKEANCLNNMKSPKDAKSKEITLVLAQVSTCSIKGQKYTFQIVSRDETTFLKAETKEEMDEWIAELQNTCHSLLTDKIEVANSNEPTDSPTANQKSDARKTKPLVPPENTTLSLFLQKNDYCTECSKILSEGYQGHIESAFVSLKLGCVLCEECAVCHYEVLGRECSDVHAMQDHPTIPLFDPKQKPMEMSFLNYMGNKKVNDYWEANLSGYNRPISSSTHKERKLWVKEKYLRKTFRGHKQGDLMVRRDRKKAKKYWVVLEASTINFYNSREDQKAVEIIVLQSCGVKVGDDPACPETFTLITPGNTYKLEATTFPAAMEWANSISIASASLMKQLTNTSDSTGGQKRAAVPTDYVVSPRGGNAIKPIRRYGMEADNTEWGKTLTSLIQLEEQTQNLRDSYNESQISSSMKKISSLDDQKFEIGNLLLGLPFDEAPSHLSKLVQDENTGHVIGGPIEALIEFMTTTDHRLCFPIHLVSDYLTNMTTEDRNFAYSWMLTYRALVSPTLFLCELSRHFKRNDIPTQQHILGFVESWIHSHFYDLAEDGNTIRMLLAFLNKTVSKSGYEAEATRYRSMLRNQTIARLVPQRVIYDSAPEPIVPDEKELEFLSLTDLDDMEIARQLCLIDQKLFQAIKPSEFLDLGWTVNDKHVAAPNITKFLERFELVVNWVLTTINKLDKPKRPYMLSKFIQIAKFCKDLRNFNACMQIMTAIEDTIMLRFDGTWEGISQKYVPILLDLRKLMSKSDNYNNLKQEIYKRTDPCVPYLQAYLYEIESITIQEANYLDGKINLNPKIINFDKFKSIARVIAEIRRYQKASYILLPQPTVQCFLLNITVLSPAELSALALMTHNREEILGYHSKSKKPDLKMPEEEAPKPPAEEKEALIDLPQPVDLDAE